MVIAMDAGRYVAGFDVMDVALMLASMVFFYEKAWPLSTCESPIRKTIRDDTG